MNDMASEPVCKNLSDSQSREHNVILERNRGMSNWVPFCLEFMLKKQMNLYMYLWMIFYLNTDLRNESNDLAILSKFFDLAIDFDFATATRNLTQKGADEGCLARSTRAHHSSDLYSIAILAEMNLDRDSFMANWIVIWKMDSFICKLKRYDMAMSMASKS